MNYIEQIRFFWRLHEEHLFTTTEVAVYFHLLEVCNICQWKNPFKRNNAKIEADLSISFNTLKNARNKLQQAGLLSFKTTNGSPNVAYTLSNFDKVSSKVAVKVADEVSSEVGDEVLPTKDKLNLNKTKPNKDTPLPPAGEEPPKIDFDFYVTRFNEACKSLPKIQKLSDARKKKLAARIKEFGAEKVTECFELAEKSDFVSGRGGKWKASFDWLMEPRNFLKVIEGNYKNSSYQASSLNLGALQTDTSKW